MIDIKKIKIFIISSYSLVKLTFLSSTAYFINLISGVFARVIGVSTILLIWYVNLNSEGSNINNFNNIFTYYIVGELIYLVVFFRTSIGGDILQGRFSIKLLRPYSVWLSYFLEEVGYSLSGNMVTFITILSIAIIGKQYLIIPADFFTWILFSISVLLGWILTIMFEYFLGWMAFFVKNNMGVGNLFKEIAVIFSGRLVPLNVISFLSSLIFLPFAGTFFIPMQIYLGNYNHTDSLYYICIQLFWCLSFYILAKFLYFKGLKHYESVGL